MKGALACLNPELLTDERRRVHSRSIRKEEPIATNDDETTRVNRPLAPNFVFRIRRHLSSAIGGVFAVTSLVSADIPEYRLLSGHRTFIHML